MSGVMEMKQLVIFSAQVPPYNMENTPLCYIVPNCNIDGRQHGARTDGTRTDGKNNGYIIKRLYSVRNATPNTATIYTENDFFKKIEKLY